MVWFTLDPLNEKKISRPISAGLRVSKYYQTFSFCFLPDLTLRSRKDERISNICSRKGFKTAKSHLVHSIGEIRRKALSIKTNSSLAGANLWGENVKTFCQLGTKEEVEKKESSSSIFENFNSLQKGLALWPAYPHEGRPHRRNFQQMYLAIKSNLC